MEPLELARQALALGGPLLAALGAVHLALRRFERAIDGKLDAAAFATKCEACEQRRKVERREIEQELSDVQRDVAIQLRDKADKLALAELAAQLGALATTLRSLELKVSRLDAVLDRIDLGLRELGSDVKALRLDGGPRK